MRSQLPDALSFIAKFRQSPETFEEASWRENGFEDDVWHCRFGKLRFDIDFRVLLDDGSVLTSPQRRPLLRDVKRFLCLQTHPVLTGGRNQKETTKRQRIAFALQILDYFLLRSDRFKVSKKGLSYVTADDVTSLVEILTERRRVKESIYEPQRRIVEFLRGVSTPRMKVIETAREQPELFVASFQVEGTTMLLPQLFRARAWLHRNGYYYPQKKVTDFAYRVVRTRLLDTVIGHRVLSGLKFDELILDDFDVAPVQLFHREMKAVPVTNLGDDDRASGELVASYISILESMRVARANGINLLTHEALAGLEQSALLRQERTRARGRFTTLPFEVANSLLGDAIGFFFEYGEELVEYYLACARSGCDVRFLPIEVPPKLGKLGIQAWRTEASTPEQFFIELRRGANLLNMLEVLYGAVLIIVNTLMARRRSELLELTKQNIVKSSMGYFLSFKLGKASVGEHNSQASRPLPDVAAKALMLLGRMTTEIGEMGYQTSPYLFAAPYSAWHQNAPFYAMVEPDLTRYLDRFCDYFQVACDEKGRRYYVRLHQLRRNFAMLFIWYGSFGGIEVLRYFLGHINPAHIYRYITESISGKALRGMKAVAAKRLITVDHSATEALAAFICRRYQITMDDLHILPEADVIAYVEELLETGEAEIEPEFFQGHDGQQYRFVYKVYENRREAA